MARITNSMLALGLACSLGSTAALAQERYEERYRERPQDRTQDRYGDRSFERERDRSESFDRGRYDDRYRDQERAEDLFGYHEEGIQLSKLPQEVQQSIKRQAGSSEIARIDQETVRGQVLYKVLVKRDGKRQFFRVGAQGDILGAQPAQERAWSRYEDQGRWERDRREMLERDRDYYGRDRLDRQDYDRPAYRDRDYGAPLFQGRGQYEPRPYDREWERERYSTRNLDDRNYDQERRRDLSAEREREMQRERIEGRTPARSAYESREGRTEQRPMERLAEALEWKQENIQLNDVPAEVRAAIQKHAGNATITRIDRETNRGQVRYKVTSTGDDQKMMFRISPTGEFIGAHPEDTAEEHKPDKREGSSTEQQQKDSTRGQERQNR